MKGTKATYLAMTVKQNDDGYLAECPSIQGAFAEGDTIDEALFNCIDVIKMISSYRKERGDALDTNDFYVSENTCMTVSIPVGLQND
jgi:predicted RNase H-like HicB family nuclease